MLGHYVLIGMAIGVVAEIIARVLRLWEFRHWSLALLNIVLLYGLTMGFLATLLRPLGALVVFVAAFVVGLAGELLNLQFLHLWRFPDGRADSSAARAAMVLVISLLWGTVPLLAAQGDLVLKRNYVFEARPDPAEALNLRERVLLDKQEALQQRLRDTDSRLRGIRKRRERLQHKRQVQVPGQETPQQGSVR